MNGVDLAEHFKAAMEGRAPNLPRVAGRDVERRYIIRHHELAALVEAALSNPTPGHGEAVPVADQLMEIRGRLVEQRQDAAAEAVGMAVACLLAAPSGKPAKQEDGDV